MNIGVISDTHLVSGGFGLKKLAMQVVSKNTQGMNYLKNILDIHFKNKVERIFHAGDVLDRGVLDLLEEYAPVDAVLGNMDGATLGNELPSKKIIEIEGRRIGLVHGWGSPNGIVERVRNQFESVDAIVFGHTHSAMNEAIGAVFFFNPGSAIDRRFAPYRSIGMLTVEPDKLSGRIIKLE